MSRPSDALERDADRLAERAIRRAPAWPGAPARRPASGEQINASLRSCLSAELGHDFGGVRIHHDAEADEAARGLHARAFTVGDDVVLRSDEHRPDTERGRKLLAHELAHVAQDRARGPAAGPAVLHRTADDSPAQQTPAIPECPGSLQSLSAEVAIRFLVTQHGWDESEARRRLDLVRCHGSPGTEMCEVVFKGPPGTAAVEVTHRREDHIASAQKVYRWTPLICVYRWSCEGTPAHLVLKNTSCIP